MEGGDLNIDAWSNWSMAWWTNEEGFNITIWLGAKRISVRKFLFPFFIFLLVFL